MKLFKHNQIGRSMVEMLGVLAIIGVLSVGGIAGYSKAMLKHKMNKTIDHFTQIIANISSLYAGKSDFGDVNESTIKATGLIPDDILIPDKQVEVGGGYYRSVYTQNAFGGEIYIRTYDNSKAIMIEFDDLPLGICTYLYSYDWSSYSNVRGISAGVDGFNIAKDCTNGDTQGGGINVSACQLPVSPTKAAEYCNPATLSATPTRSFAIALEI